MHLPWPRNPLQQQDITALWCCWLHPPLRWLVTDPTPASQEPPFHRWLPRGFLKRPDAPIRNEERSCSRHTETCMWYVTTEKGVSVFVLFWVCFPIKLSGNVHNGLGIKRLWLLPFFFLIQDKISKMQAYLTCLTREEGTEMHFLQWHFHTHPFQGPFSALLFPVSI